MKFDNLIPMFGEGKNGKKLTRKASKHQQANNQVIKNAKNKEKAFEDDKVRKANGEKPKYPQATETGKPSYKEKLAATYEGKTMKEAAEGEEKLKGQAKKQGEQKQGGKNYKVTDKAEDKPTKKADADKPANKASDKPANKNKPDTFVRGNKDAEPRKTNSGGWNSNRSTPAGRPGSGRPENPKNGRVPLQARKSAPARVVADIPEDPFMAGVQGRAVAPVNYQTTSFFDGLNQEQQAAPAAPARPASVTDAEGRYDGSEKGRQTVKGKKQAPAPKNNTAFGGRKPEPVEPKGNATVQGRKHPTGRPGAGRPARPASGKAPQPAYKYGNAPVSAGVAQGPVQYQEPSNLKGVRSAAPAPAAPAAPAQAAQHAAGVPVQGVVPQGKAVKVSNAQAAARSAAMHAGDGFEAASSQIASRAVGKGTSKALTTSGLLGLTALAGLTAYHFMTRDDDDQPATQGGPQKTNFGQQYAESQKGKAYPYMGDVAAAQAAEVHPPAGNESYNPNAHSTDDPRAQQPAAQPAAQRRNTVIPAAQARGTSVLDTGAVRIDTRDVEDDIEIDEVSGIVTNQPFTVNGDESVVYVNKGDKLYVVEGERVTQLVGEDLTRAASLITQKGSVIKPISRNQAVAAAQGVQSQGAQGGKKTKSNVGNPGARPAASQIQAASPISHAERNAMPGVPRGQQMPTSSNATYSGPHIPMGAQSYDFSQPKSLLQQQGEMGEMVDAYMQAMRGGTNMYQQGGQVQNQDQVMAAIMKTVKELGINPQEFIKAVQAKMSQSQQPQAQPQGQASAYRKGGKTKLIKKCCNGGKM